MWKKKNKKNHIYINEYHFALNGNIFESFDINMNTRSFLIEPIKEGDPLLSDLIGIIHSFIESSRIVSIAVSWDDGLTLYLSGTIIKECVLPTEDQLNVSGIVFHVSVLNSQYLHPVK